MKPNRPDTIKEPRYRVTGYGKSNDIMASELAAFCLHQCGGGYTTEQTAKAIEMQRNAIDTGRLVPGITIEEIK